MTEVRWTETAYEDLAAIRDFVRHDSPAYAQLVVAQLYESVGQLRQFPESGRVVPERGDPSLRELIRPPYRIVYRRHQSSVEILTIFHSARLPPGTLRGAERPEE
ncbi:MAG: type II toxin-antitoxin system RelE/ParE family toxin [Gemmatimonadaceae bacterium]